MGQRNIFLFDFQDVLNDCASEEADEDVEEVDFDEDARLFRRRFFRLRRPSRSALLFSRGESSPSAASIVGIGIPTTPFILFIVDCRFLVPDARWVKTA